MLRYIWQKIRVESCLDEKTTSLTLVTALSHLKSNDFTWHGLPRVEDGFRLGQLRTPVVPELPVVPKSPRFSNSNSSPQNDQAVDWMTPKSTLWKNFDEKLMYQRKVCSKM